MTFRFICIMAVAFAGLLPLRAAKHPKLVVAIVVDQLRYDYLERAPEKFANEGFRVFLDRGTFMTFARYNYFPTVTGPGHASIFSGCGPALHGIIGNDWHDKRTGKTVYCCDDTNVVAVGTTNKSAMSPKNLVGATVADEMRLHFNSKVIGISIKDRGAILPAGKKPRGAYWYNSKSGNFITSTYYMTNLPKWVEEFNARQLPASYSDRPWERMFAEEEYSYRDQAPGEGKLHKGTNVFTHTIRQSTNGFDTLVTSPFGDDLLTEFAMAAIDGEELGQGDQPDLLTVSFSSMDSIGHTFGPYSHEIQDETFRLDRQLERLFQHIDLKVGLANVMMVLTADHAVAPAPEYAKDLGLDGQRWDSAKFMTNLQNHLISQFGAGSYFAPFKLVYNAVFLNQETLREKQLSKAAVVDAIREFSMNTGVFLNCFTREQLLEGHAHGQLGEFFANGFNAERSGDLVFVPKPCILSGTDKTGTTHGSVYSYDTRVPILFFGQAFKPGRYADEFYITDIAATLCAALRINEPPLSIGKPCVRILADQQE